MTDQPIRARRPTGTAMVLLAGLILAALPAVTRAQGGESYEEWISNVASEEPVNVRIVHWFDPHNPGEHNQAYLDRVDSEWHRRYPNGTISWELVGWGEIDQKTPAFVMAGDPVDISYNWGGATENWCSAGLVVDLAGQMPAWWVAERLPAQLEPPSNTLCSDGRLAMAAVGVEAQAMLVRGDRLAAAGVDPASMTSHEGFVAGLRALAEADGAPPLGMALGADWTAMDEASFLWLGNGLTFGDFRPDGSEEGAWVETATFLDQLFDLTPEAALGWSHEDVQLAFATDQVAAMDAGTWFYGGLRALDPEGDIVNPESLLLIPYPDGPSSGSDSGYHTASYTGFYRLVTSPDEEPHRQAVLDLLAIATDTDAVWLHSDGTVPATIGWTAADRLKVAYDKEIGWWWEDWEGVTSSSRTVPFEGFVARDEITAAAYPLLTALFRDEIGPQDLYRQLRELALPLIEATSAS